MMLWLKRATLVTTAVVTLGLALPAGVTKAEQLDMRSATKPVSEVPDKPTILKVEQGYGYSDPAIDGALTYKDFFKTEFFLEHTLLQAYEQGIVKFGPKITDKIGEQYEDFILPRFKEVLEEVTADVDTTEIDFLRISNDPAAGMGEKILHVYDERDGSDFVRFHVRRENPPRQGYWFDFHYHLAKDNFEEHYELGKIYWDKNTPPLWQA